MRLPNDIDNKLKAFKKIYKESAKKLGQLETKLGNFKRKNAKKLKIRQEEVKISDPQLVKDYFNIYQEFNDVLAEIQKIQSDNAQYKKQINSKIMRYINGYGSIVLNYLYVLETLSKCENLGNHGKCKDFFFQLGKETCIKFLDMIAGENWGEESEGKSSNRKYFSEKTVEKTKDIEGIAKFFRDYFQLQTYETSFFNNFFRIQEDSESKQEVLDQTETQSKRQSRRYRQQINEIRNIADKIHTQQERENSEQNELNEVRHSARFKTTVELMLDLFGRLNDLLDQPNLDQIDGLKDIVAKLPEYLEKTRQFSENECWDENEKIFFRNSQNKQETNELLDKAKISIKTLQNRCRVANDIKVKKRTKHKRSKQHRQATDNPRKKAKQIPQNDVQTHINPSENEAKKADVSNINPNDNEQSAIVQENQDDFLMADISNMMNATERRNIQAAPSQSNNVNQHEKSKGKSSEAMAMDTSSDTRRRKRTPTHQENNGQLLKKQKTKAPMNPEDSRGNIHCVKDTQNKKHEAEILKLKKTVESNWQQKMLLKQNKEILEQKTVTQKRTIEALRKGLESAKRDNTWARKEFGIFKINLEKTSNNAIQENAVLHKKVTNLEKENEGLKVKLRKTENEYETRNSYLNKHLNKTQNQLEQVDDDLTKKRAQHKQKIKFLSQQNHELQRKLQQSEAQLQQYRTFNPSQSHSTYYSHSSIASQQNTLFRPAASHINSDYDPRCNPEDNRIPIGNTRS